MRANPCLNVPTCCCSVDADVKKWGIVGIGLMPWDSKMYNILKEQDHLYTLLSRGHTGSEARVVGSIVDFMFAPEDHQAVIDKVCSIYVRSCIFLTQVLLHLSCCHWKVCVCVLSRCTWRYLRCTIMATPLMPPVWLMLVVLAADRTGVMIV